MAITTQVWYSFLSKKDRCIVFKKNDILSAEKCSKIAEKMFENRRKNVRKSPKEMFENRRKMFQNRRKKR
jgi:16S rRNA A1518/A1519 N6-dimethyltransferase RsmA/KsgA/DIM1 with predicted DNA glycosylase/AP lyase activity